MGRINKCKLLENIISLYYKFANPNLEIFLLIGIVDYKSNNINAVYRQVKLFTNDVKIVSVGKQLDNLSKIILPGVGHFGAAAKILKETGLEDAIKEKVIVNKIPILGICLGMQLLGNNSSESPGTAGMALLSGITTKLSAEPGNHQLKVPHIGWNSIFVKKESPLLKNITAEMFFFFSHSYTYTPAFTSEIIATTSYGNDLATIVEDKHIFGVQFHPEKSRTAGALLIKNFIGI